MGRIHGTICISDFWKIRRSDCTRTLACRSWVVGWGCPLRQSRLPEQAGPRLVQSLPLLIATLLLRPRIRCLFPLCFLPWSASLVDGALLDLQVFESVSPASKPLGEMTGADLAHWCGVALNGLVVLAGGRWISKLSMPREFEASVWFCMLAPDFHGGIRPRFHQILMVSDTLAHKNLPGPFAERKKRLVRCF